MWEFYHPCNNTQVYVPSLERTVQFRGNQFATADAELGAAMLTICQSGKSRMRCTAAQSVAQPPAPAAEPEKKATKKRGRKQAASVPD